MTYVLIGINVVVFAAIQLWYPLVNTLALHVHSFCDVYPTRILDVAKAQCGVGAYAPGTLHGGAWWQPLTSMFTHQAFWHIGGNMLSLWMIGPLLEAAIGRGRYLGAYLVTGLAGSALVMATADRFTVTLGASGAIFGLLGVLVVLFLRRGLPLQQLGTVVVLNFFITFTVSGISWEAHVGGFLAGLAIGAAYAYAPRLRSR